MLDIQGNGSHILGRLLHAVGVPIGDKSITRFLVPNWVMNGYPWIKKLFLNIILGNELQVPKLASYGCHFEHAHFRMVKTKEYMQNNEQFLNQIRRLLKEFGIQTSKVKQDKSRKDRKDGKISIPMYFQIQRNKLNILKFHGQFTLLYTSRKQRIFDMAVNSVKKNLKNELRKINYYKKAKKMQALGLGCRKLQGIWAYQTKKV